MALENQARAGMTPKQKGMIGAIIVIILVLIWQVMGLMGGGTSVVPAPSPKPESNQGAKMDGAAPVGANPVNNQMAAQTELRQAHVTNDARYIQFQQMTEQKYINKINDLEDLKLQREIAETNQAIAAAKLATVTAEKNISDLLTKPAVPTVPQGAYANQLANPAVQSEAPASPPAAVPVSSALPQADYSVISVSMQLGKWSAVIGYQGRLYNVVVGDTLPADNSVVVKISNNGVELKQDGKTRKINIMLAI